MLLDVAFEATVRARSDQTALIAGERRVTYAEVDAAANRLAHGLVDAGVARGDRVVVQFDNSIEAVVAVYAILKASAVFVLANPTVKPDKLAFLLADCRATALVAPANRILALGPLPPSVRAAFATERADDDPRQDRLLRFDAPDRSAAPMPKRNIDIDLAALVYTSGTTGRPKGVMLTHLNMSSAAASIIEYLENRAGDVVLNALPLSFDYGLYQVLMAFRYGGTVVLERSFVYPHAVLETAVRERVTGLPLVPTMIAMLLQMDLSAYDWSALRYVTTTAAAAPPEHLLRLQAAFPRARVYSMYGLTECKRVSYLPPDQLAARPASVGRGMPNQEIYLVDDAGLRLGPDSVGELVVRGAHVMRGYWERPEETLERLRPGPLPGELALHTGDFFRMDAEGYLTFVGRRDDMLKSRGEKVSPREVENALASHPGVAEAAVFGVPHPVLGEAICAHVVLRAGIEASVADLKRHCADRLESFMVPQAIVVRASLPRTPNGKVDKAALAGEESPP